MIKHLKQFFWKHWFLLALLLLILIYTAIFSFFVLERSNNFEIREAGDTSTFLQVIYNNASGRFFTTSIPVFGGYALPDRPYNFLGDQLELILFLFTPLALFFKPPNVFFLLQVIIVGLSIIPLSYLARDVTGSRLLSILIAVSFLLNPMSYDTYFRFGFRPETIAIPLLISAFYFVHKNRYIYASLFFFLTLLVKHDSVMVVFLSGLFILFFKKDYRRYGFLIILMTLCYYIIGVEMIFKKLASSPNAHFRHLTAFGETPWKAMINIFSHPFQVFSFISQNEIKYINQALLSTLYLPLMSPYILLSSPIFFVNFVLGDYQSIFATWHWSLVIPVLYISCIYSIASLLNIFSKLRSLNHLVLFFSTLLIFGIIYEANIFSKTLSEREHFHLLKNNIDTRPIIKKIREIPKDASVIASSRLFPFLADREKVYQTYQGFKEDVDYLIILLPIGYPPHYRSGDRYLNILINEFINNNEDSFLSRHYDVEYWSNNMVIFARRKE